MKPRDPLVQTLLACFVPLYTIYWSYAVAKEIHQTYSIKIPNILLLLAPAILAVAGVFLLIIVAGLNSDEAGGAVVGGLLLVGIFIAFPLSLVLTLVYYYQFGGAVEKLLGPEASRMLTFVLFWFVPAAGVYIIQEKLSRIAAPPQQQWQPPQPTQPPQNPAA